MEMFFFLVDWFGVLLYSPAQCNWHGMWWREDMQEVRGGHHFSLPVVHMAWKKLEMVHAGYSIFDDIAYPLLSATAMIDESSILSDFF